MPFVSVTTALFRHTAVGEVDGDGVELEADDDVDGELALELAMEDVAAPLPEGVEVDEAPDDEILIAPM